jgi:hypothetical protein
LGLSVLERVAGDEFEAHAAHEQHDGSEFDEFHVDLLKGRFLAGGQLCEDPSAPVLYNIIYIYKSQVILHNKI